MVFALEVKKMNAKTELEGNYLRHHPSEKELERHEQEYLESCLIPEMEERHYKKLGNTGERITFPVLSRKHFSVIR